MAGLRVLIVDDEPMVRDVLARYLTKEGFVVSQAADGEEALERAADDDPDLVLLDLMLPKLDGYEVFSRLRDRGRTMPVIMLTARGEETDRVVGLDMGADDYVTKPFSPREVVSRVRAVLRRAGTPAIDGPPPLLEFNGLVIDAARREASVGGETRHLTRKEFDLLLYLASSPGVTFTRTQLLEDVWDFAWDGDSATVTVHVRRLREKIEDDPSEPRHVVTVWGVGYRFEP
ncbi:MAG: response regulator transcription factor [Actinomycetota bacterium]